MQNTPIFVVILFLNVSIIVSTVAYMSIVSFLFLFSSIAFIFLSYPVLMISRWSLSIAILAISVHNSAISIVPFAHTILTIATPLKHTQYVYHKYIPSRL